jgi:hypothetical protein
MVARVVCGLWYGVIKHQAPRWQWGPRAAVLGVRGGAWCGWGAGGFKFKSAAFCILPWAWPRSLCDGLYGLRRLDISGDWIYQAVFCFAIWGCVACRLRRSDERLRLRRPPVASERRRWLRPLHGQERPWCRALLGPVPFCFLCCLLSTPSLACLLLIDAVVRSCAWRPHQLACEPLACPQAAVREEAARERI